MSKTKLTRAQMCKKILAAIQECPGCENVKTAAKSIWRVSVIDSGGVEIERVNHAALKVQQELRLHYDLLT